MYKNILVPVAFEGETILADKAIAAAKTLADEGATIRLLHVVEDVPAFAMSYVSVEMMTETRDAMRAQMDAFAATVPGATGDVVGGHTSRSILDYAAEHDCDVIVIASHRPGMQSFLLGSTATHVVRHATCAVHVLR